MVVQNPLFLIGGKNHFLSVKVKANSSIACDHIIILLYQYNNKKIIQLTHLKEAAGAGSKCTRGSKQDKGCKKHVQYLRNSKSDQKLFKTDVCWLLYRSSIM